ncbi:MAG TPA: hypothetical protein VIN06_10500 [Devosia sp.]
MDLLRSAASLGLLLLGTGMALADASLSDMAKDAACRLDRVREIIAGAERSAATPDEADQLIVENTADWLPDYNVFASSPEAADLLATVTAAPEKLPAAQCRQLLPFAAVSASAERISRAGGDVAPGNVLVNCESGDGLCLPEATARIVEQCGSALFTLPLRTTC